MKLSLGALQYYWPKQTTFDFYQAVSKMPVDIVYLGQTVCARRHEMRLEDWLNVAQMLTDAGKQVVLATQVLLESGAHLQQMHAICDNGTYAVLANDMGAVGALENKVPFIAGAHLNLYHTQAVQMLASLGAKRWVAPVEMSRETLQTIVQASEGAIETEVFAFGRMPLAYSARCFTARYHNLQKDDCRFKCLDDLHGLCVKTREGAPFVVFNGIQTLSDATYNLIGEISQMRKIGVDVVQLSPQQTGMADIVSLFYDVIHEKIPAQAACEKMREFMLSEPCNGYWFGREGMAWCDSPSC